MSSSRRQYPFRLIEPKWQKVWAESQSFRAFNPGEEIPANHPFALRHKLSGKVSAAQLPEKFYILDMFPYPSGAGLHVGHPEGYTATDILARYKRAQGFNVLHPMGWDAFGLPAEQYAVKTGQHPRVTTEANIANFTRQIKSLGFSYDWSRELATTDPDYFKWTQWIFLKLYNSWFNPKTNKAEPIETLKFPAELQQRASGVLAGSSNQKSDGSAAGTDGSTLESARRAYRDSKRLAYVSEAPVNWCPELGTVLANEEVIDGKSEVGGFPVIRKPMRQWMLRITAYAEKLLADLDTIDWTDSLKEMQRNWIGRSEGAEVDFQVAGSSEKIRVFTTRPDTLFGATYLVLSPEHKLLTKIIPEDWPSETPYYWKGPGKEIVGLLRPGEKHIANWDKVSIPSSQEPLGRVGEVQVEIISVKGWKPVANLPEEIQWQIARYKALVLSATPSRITIALSDLSDLIAVDAIHFLVNREVEVKVASELEITVAIRANFGGSRGEWSPVEAVKSYQDFAASKSDLERTELAKEKTGVFTGAYAINPVNGEKIPIWIADYVLASYGTGAIMAVPAHDERDCEFAVKFKLPIRKVVLAPEEFGKGEPSATIRDWFCFVGYGFAWNSENSEISLNSLPTVEAKAKISTWLEEKSLGKRTINYKLRDWLFSRQRYWGEPFPIIWKKDAAGNLQHEAVPEKSLPVLPPTLEDYKPTTDGQPPLARATDWVNLKSGAVRETNTMPQWAGSCWYYLRYLDTQNPKRFVSRAAEHYWMGSQLPVGVVRCLSADEWRRELTALETVAFQETGRQIPRSVLFSEVSLRLSGMIRDASGEDVSDFWHSLDALHLRHIGKHSNVFLETRRGNLPLTEEDLLALPEILANPDSVEFSSLSPNGFKRFVILKRINGAVFVVEEMRGRERQLQVITFWKRTATAKDVIAKMPLSDTSGNDRRTAANKPDARPTVKSKPGVDLYVGGTEHAVLHLLYARFWHKVLFDLGYVSTPEPFFKLVNQGLILGEDGQKMSKSRGNVVNPDDVLVDYGADAFRLYEMFMGPLQDTKPWNTKGVEGVYRFLGRVWRLFVDEKSETAFEQAETTAELSKRGELLDLILLDGGIADMDATPAQLKTLHACIKKVTEDLDGMRFNTAISAMMVFINEVMTWQTKPLSVMKTFLQLLAPFAPHIAEELWARLHTTFGQSATSLAYAPWPKFDAALLVESEIEIPVQVNGKLRDVIKVSVNATVADLETAAKNSEKVKPFIEGKTIKKIIVVPKKMVNLIVG